MSQGSLNGARKSFNRVEEYRDIVKRIHAHGIAVQAGVVFGFDEDRLEVFRDTLDFLEDAGIQNATFNILTPYPGTPLFRRLQCEGRYEAVQVANRVVLDTAVESAVLLCVENASNREGDMNGRTDARRTAAIAAETPVRARSHPALDGRRSQCRNLTPSETDMGRA